MYRTSHAAEAAHSESPKERKYEAKGADARENRGPSTPHCQPSPGRQSGFKGADLRGRWRQVSSFRLLKRTSKQTDNRQRTHSAAVVLCGLNIPQSVRGTGTYLRRSPSRSTTGAVRSSDEVGKHVGTGELRAVLTRSDVFRDLRGSPLVETRGSVTPPSNLTNLCLSHLLS
jgi:hypothetical protein